MRLTVHQAVQQVKNCIMENPTLLSYAESDLANLKELTDEFVPRNTYHFYIATSSLKNPAIMISKLMDVFFLPSLEMTPYTRDILIGYCFLIRSHIGFYQNEQT